LNFKKDFEKNFVNKEKQYLFDCVDKGEKIDLIRPNAIIGLSLPFALLSAKDEKMILNTAEERLLTDLGLFTLDPSDKNFNSNISGNIDNRDLAYHNGAIWPFLLGLYLKAYLRVNKNSRASKDYVFKKLINFWEKLCEKDLNYIPEIFAPCDMHPDGCLTQAWNYATLLEVLYDFENSK
jgi:glycogen debranching enzyme